jgi:dephospho-CoA kinase
MKLRDKFIRLNIHTRLHQCPIPMIGVSGGIGSGKSFFCQYIVKKYQLHYLSADSLVKIAYQRPSIINFLKQNVSEVLEENNDINFKLLRHRFFNDVDLKIRLEQIIYAELPKIFHSQIKAEMSYLIYEVPLLFELKLQDKIDQTILVSTSIENQINRVMNRDGVSKQDAQLIINQQMSLKEKEKLADWIIHNNQSIDDQWPDADQLINTLFTE